MPAKLSLHRDCRSPHTHFPLCSHQLSLGIQGEFFPWDSSQAKHHIPPLQGPGTSSWRSMSSLVNANPNPDLFSSKTQVPTINSFSLFPFWDSPEYFHHPHAFISQFHVGGAENKSYFFRFCFVADCSPWLMIVACYNNCTSLDSLQGTWTARNGLQNNKKAELELIIFYLSLPLHCL